MKNSTILTLLMLLLAMVISAFGSQKIKPWTEWTVRDAQKVLDDSPWGKTQVDTDTTQMTFSPATRDITGQGAINQATSVSIHVYLLSAKPIRLAFLRQLQLTPSHTPEQLSQMQAFVDRKFDQSIVMAVTYGGTDGRYTAALFQSLNTAITATLKNTTFLETKGGKRNFLQEYEPPLKDGLAKFIFARNVDGQPFIDAKSGQLRFYSELPKLSGNNQPSNNRKDSSATITINITFKVADLMYEGVLEL